MIELNPLNVLNKRMLDIMPVHFRQIKLGLFEFSIPEVINWVNSKLEGRYSITVEPFIDSDGQFRLSTFIGFENQKELTYFMLACPYLRRN